MNTVGFQFIPRGDMLLENIVYNELVTAGYQEIAFAHQGENVISLIITICFTCRRPSSLFAKRVL
jgi:hypothetical protein